MVRSETIKKTLAIFFIISIINGVLPYNLLYANSNGPGSPEASSFEPVDAPDMVNLVTGDLTYNIPILNVPSPEGGYPLSLAYHAGIKMEQEASWVGLGWNINPGAINRGLNGVPDDHHNFKIQDVNYNLLDKYKDFSVAVDYAFGAGTAGLSYSTHKGFGGQANFMGSGFNWNEEDGLTGMMGISAGSSIASAGAQLNYNFKDKNTSLGLSGQISLGVNASTGISFSSRGASTSSSVGIGVAGMGSQSFGGGVVSGAVSTNYDGFTYTIPIWTTGFLLTVSSNEVTQWVYSNETNFSVGSLTFQEDYEVYKDRQNDFRGKFFTTDVTMQPDNPYELGVGAHIPDAAKKDELWEINLPSYDKYVVSAQGITGNFSPRYYQDIKLPLGIRGRKSKELDPRQNDEFLSLYRTYLWDSIGKIEEPKFYFENEFSSYLEIQKVKPDTDELSEYYAYWDLNSFDNSESITSVEQSTKRFSKIGDDEGYNSKLHRKNTGSVIEEFKKEDVYFSKDYPSHFMFATNNDEKLDYQEIFSRTEDSKHSIIGFKITALDGKTYHYSLPVYQKEMISRVEKKDKPNEKFNEHRNFSNYATHWLLTAVTGPDFVDVNHTGFPDEDDYGYWVRFEYGKWSDGFGWKTDSTTSKALEDCDLPLDNPEECKEVFYSSNAKGVKEVYYLNKIKTRTHSALFLKSIRSDANGEAFREGESKNNPKKYENVTKSMQKEGYGVNVSQGDFYSYYNVEKQDNFKLDQIILLKNEDDNYVSNQSDKSPKKGGEFYFKEHSSVYKYPQNRWYDVKNVVHENEWEAEFYDNILEVEDISNYGELISKSIKAVKFNYDYSIKNSDLKLLGFRMNTRNGSSLIPDYTFDYYDKLFYENQKEPRWGYNQDTKAWSLKSIRTPLGSKINIEYEKDSFLSLTELKKRNSAQPWQKDKYREGGLRVKKISLTDTDLNKYETNYLYTDGVTYSRPEIIPNTTTKFLDYEEDVFGFQGIILYRNVTQVDGPLNDNNSVRTEYLFDVPEPYTYESQWNFGLLFNPDIDRFISKLKASKSIDGATINRNGRVYKVKKQSFGLKDRRSSLGRLLKKDVYNGYGQRLSSLENNYKTFSTLEPSQGVEQETFSSYKKFLSFDENHDFLGDTDITTHGAEYWLLSSSKTTYPSVLESTMRTSNGITKEVKFSEYDFLSGKNTEVITTNNKGNSVKRRVTLAYKKYPGMGSKLLSNDPVLRTNKNMLVQEAQNVNFIKDDGVWKEVSADVTSWDYDLYTTYYNGSIPKFSKMQEPQKRLDHKVWRARNNYTWTGNRDNDGFLTDFSGNFDWSMDALSQDPKWFLTTSVTRYNDFSKAIETKDAANNYLSNKMSADHTKVIAVGNSRYDDLRFSGAEYLNEEGNLSDELGSSGRNSEKAHTGNYSLKVSQGEAFMKGLSEIDNRVYKISVWTDINNYKNARVWTGNGALKEFNGETTIAGDWVLLNHYEYLDNSNGRVYVTSIEGESYFDDFRMHPVSSKMKSYVYDEYGRLSAMLNENNIATQYEYDDADRLIKVYQETVNADGLSGGFKLVKEYTYSYKLETNRSGSSPVGGYPEMSFDLTTEDPSGPGLWLNANVEGGSGEFEYRWAFANSLENLNYGFWGTWDRKYTEVYCADSTLYYECQLRDRITGETMTRSGFYHPDCLTRKPPRVTPNPRSNQ